MLVLVLVLSGGQHEMAMRGAPGVRAAAAGWVVADGAALGVLALWLWLWF